MPTEEQLIDAVVRIRSTTSASTAGEVHAALILEKGMADVTISQVKKASSKAMKKQPADVSDPAVAKTAVSAADPAAAEPKASKKQEKAAKAAIATMKAAEADMMEKCRALRIQLGEDPYAAAIATEQVQGRNGVSTDSLYKTAEQNRGEDFIQGVVGRALESRLSEEEILTKSALAARVEADLAVLLWALMAEKAGTLTLPDEARGTAQRQIERLKGVRGAQTLADVGLTRGASTLAQAEGCFLLPEPKEEVPVGPASGIEYSRKSGGETGAETGQSIDRMMAKRGMLAQGAGLYDDDVD